jgi:plastocyanin
MRTKSVQSVLILIGIVLLLSACAGKSILNQNVPQASTQFPPVPNQSGVLTTPEVQTTAPSVNLPPVVQPPAILNTNVNSNVSTQVQVAIQNFAFNPSSLTIKVGTTVIWKNLDSVPHKIKSDTFNSDVLNNGDTFSFKFDNKGTYNYSCAIHPFMQATITVE